MAGGGNVDDVPGLVLPHSLQEKVRVKKCTADVD